MIQIIMLSIKQCFDSRNELRDFAYCRDDWYIIQNLTLKPATLERGEILQSMGSMYDSLRQHAENAFIHFLKAKENFVFACDDINHPKICETELQIKSVQRKLDTELV